MMIHVKYKDGTVSQVHKHTLQELILSKKIEQFRRASGWVDIEKDPIRRQVVFVSFEKAV